MKPPKAQAIIWWQRGLIDGKDCARKRRGKYFSVYLEKAIAALLPGDLQGPCECVYRVAFRYGYDAEKADRVRRNTFSPRPKRRGNIHRS